MDRQHPPAAARTNQVAHGIDHLAEIYFSRSPPATRLGHQWRNLLPLLVCEVRRIALDLLGDLGHPATALLCPHPELESEIQPQRNPPRPFSKRSLRAIFERIESKVILKGLRIGFNLHAGEGG